MKLDLSALSNLTAPFLFGAVFSLGACSSTDEPADDAKDTDDGELPAALSQSSIETFLASERYKSDPWVGDTVTRASDNSVNVHGDALRVYFNSAAVRTKTSGAMVSEVGTMVVKEMYDETDVLVGRAVQIKSGEGETMNDWTFFCTSPEGSTICTGNADASPIYGAGLTECGFCHGNVPYANPPQ